jgi:cytoskeletal protein CcmA (bactofilin family)
MSKHILKGLIACIIAMLLTAFAAAPVLAADVRSGDTVTVASGEVVDGDLYAVGGDIVINGTVNGDIWAAGRTITINGTVNGAITIAGQTVIVNGPVARSARLAGQSLVINNNIKTDLVAAGATIDVGNKARIGSDLLFGCGTVNIAGQVDGNIKGGASEITISNGIGGNIKIEVETLTIASTADIQGSLDYTSENEANIQSGAKIGGKVTHQIPEAKKRAEAAGFWIAAASIASAIMWKILSFVMALVVGIIIIFTARRRIVSLADSIKSNPLSSLGWGALILFVTPIAAIIVCCTVIGLPVGIISLVLYGIAIYLSQIPVALCIGRLIIGRFREVESRGIMVGTLTTGLAILAILGWIPIIGFLVGLATAIFGLGSLVSSQIKVRAEPR